MKIGDFKDGMSQIPTSVAVISLFVGESIKACTISSLVSVDIVNPKVMFVLKNDSSTLNTIKSSLRFSISILTNNQAIISQRYSKIEAKSLESRDIDFCNYEDSGLPVLIGGYSTFFCNFDSILELSGATIVFASVENVIKGDATDPLIYFARKYFRLEEINLEPH
jgi:flavin reductase (DIM6/NTAB) family NADH-FMN oxidoreductase RutF